MDIDDVLGILKDITTDAPELIGSLSDILPEPSLKLLAMAFNLLFNSIEMARGERDKKALATVEQDISTQIPAEIAEELREFCQQFQEDGPIIPQEDRKRYLEAAFKKYPDFKYKPQLYNAFSKCVNKLEDAIRTNYSVGELGILRQVMLSRNELDSIFYAVLEGNRTIEEKIDLLRDDVRTLAESNPQPKPQAQSDGLHTSNELYAKLFTKPLFLHSAKGKNPKVNLSNLFVPPNSSIDSKLAQFIQPEESHLDELKYLPHIEEPQFLFIEGNAGWGKSSLTQYVSYHYSAQDEIAQRLLGDTQLITIRLRDIEQIPTNYPNKDRLIYAILRFLYGNEKDKANLQHFCESGSRLLWLDGYDELCTMEGIEDPQSVIGTLKSLKCKIVITTRPNYIRFGKIKNYSHIALQHFDHDQRREWLQNYETKCGETLGEVNRKYLDRVQNGNDPAGICDTPLGLYMVAAGHFDEKALDNEWALYRQIFHEEIKNTDYNESFGGIWEHPISEYWESLYQVSEEIAWYLYQRKNADSTVSNENVAKIIDKLELNGDKDAIKRCFALCSYWNPNTRQGEVEFYHNNIRDFFLCEKLMRELNRAYEKHGDCLRNKNADIRPFSEYLCELFQYGKLEERVLWLLYQRSAYTNEETNVCIETEKRYRNTARIFESLLLMRSINQNEQTPMVKSIVGILYNTVGVYRHLYEPFLKNNEWIFWWNNVKTVNEDEIFRYFSGIILHFAGPSNLSGVNLNGADLNHADFHRAILSGADLRGADLQNANLNDADLNGVDLKGANLSIAKLSSAQLNGADLRGATLRGALLKGASLFTAHLNGADLYNADLRGADLSGAYLHGTDLSAANLRGAIKAGCDMTRIIGTPIKD